MLATSFSKFLSNKNIHYAWVIVFVTFLTMLATSCALSAPGALMKSIEKEFGWTTAEISGALAIRLVLYGLIAPFAASLMKDFGIKTIILVALSLTTLGIGASLFMHTSLELFIFWGLLVGTGSGMTALVLGATIANNWFAEKRGLIMGIFSATNATGQLLFLPLITKIMEQFGWRSALFIVLSLLGIAIFFTIILMKNKPSDLGLFAFGAIKEEIASNKKQDAIGGLFMASKSATFWILFFTFFVCGASTNGLVQTHFISFCGDMGLAAVASASVLAMMGIFDLFGTIGSGFLTDRIDARILLFAYYFFRGLSLLYLPNADFSVGGLAPFSVFYGLDWVATVPPTVKLTTQKFGKENAPVVFGWVFAGHQIGAASIAFFAGWSRTALNTYYYAFLIAGILCLAAAALALFANGWIGKKQVA